MSRTFDCRCAIALRVASTLAARAVEELRIVNPAVADLLVADANKHARVLRAAGDRGNHGPHDKGFRSAALNAEAERMRK